MKKSAITLGLFGALVVGATIRLIDSYDLQDGYRLQSVFGHRGIFRGFFHPVVEGDMISVQGSRNGYIYGSTSIGTSPDPRYFILHTSTSTVEWVEPELFFSKLASYGCPRPDMNKEVNIAGLRSRLGKFSRE